MFFSPYFFKTDLHKKIYDSSSDFSIFKLSKEGISCLFPEETPQDKPILIGRKYFKLLSPEDSTESYLVRLDRKNSFPHLKIEDGQIYLNGRSSPVLDLSTFEFYNPESGKKPISVEKIYPESLLSGKSKWWRENFMKYSENEKNELEDYEETISGMDKNGTLRDFHLQASPLRPFDFYIDESFKDIGDFWKELRAYYQTELSKKIKLLNHESSPPVFTRVFRDDVDLVGLQKSMVQKIHEKMDEIRKNNSNIQDQLRNVGNEMISRGISLEDNQDYNQLFVEQKTISECLERTNETLESYMNMVSGFHEESDKLLNKPVVDINGNPLLISKYYNQITNKLISLNEEINEINRSHLSIEQELIKRLRDIEAVKDFREKFLREEQERVMEEYRYKKQQQEDRRQQLEAYRDLGSLHESAYLIQRKIDEEKRKINQYMDNLKNLSVYENYESSVLEHQRNKQKYTEDIIKFRREAYKLKMFMDRQEKKYDDFFRDVENQVVLLREDVSDACRNNFSMENSCIESWRDRWQKDGLPVVQDILNRTYKIVEAFAPIPPTQIIKICRLKEKLKKEVSSRQSEWKKVFEEIKMEFERMDYTSSPDSSKSEWDPKYLDKLDDAILTLSRENKKAIFMSPDKFQLANIVDERIGLNPKTLDDDNFTVIDQVWEELTPEQEAELEKKLKKDYDINVQRNKEELMEDQLEHLKNRFTPKKTKLYNDVGIKSNEETMERYENIEERELRLWRGDNYLIPNSRGEFKELLFEITKRLFSSKSVRMEDQKIKFTDTGLVKDGNAEIFSSKDYFIKSNDSSPFSEASDDLDLSESQNIHKEPDEEFLELISDPTYVSHAREREEKLAKAKAPIKPTITEWAQIFLKEYKKEKEKEKFQDIEHLRARVLEMDDEIKSLKSYHDRKNEELEKTLVAKNDSFKDLKEKIEETKTFLKTKDQELRSIMKGVDAGIDEVIEGRKDDLFKKKIKTTEEKRGLFYWLSRFIYGPKDDDFTDS